MANIYKATKVEYEEVADAIRNINGEWWGIKEESGTRSWYAVSKEEMETMTESNEYADLSNPPPANYELNKYYRAPYKWTEDYIAKLGEIEEDMSHYDEIVDAVKDIIKDNDPDDAEAIDNANVGPADIKDAIDGDGILIDEEEEEYTPSILDIIEELKDRLEMYTDDFEVFELTGDWSGDREGHADLRLFVETFEKNHLPRITDPNYAEKMLEIATKKKVAVYICKTLYENIESLLCIPTEWEA